MAFAIYLFTGTKMFKRRTAEGLILVERIEEGGHSVLYVVPSRQ